jgi:hypothetical protein
MSLLCRRLLLSILCMQCWLVCFALYSVAPSGRRDRYKQNANFCEALHRAADPDVAQYQLRCASCTPP